MDTINMFLMILLPLAMALPQYNHFSGANSSHHLNKRDANGGINCGGHTVDFCDQCSDRDDPTRCNSDCMWRSGVCTYKDISVFKKEVLYWTNNDRKSAGKEPLIMSNQLSISAQNWADNLKEKCLYEHSNAVSENLLARCYWTLPGYMPTYMWSTSPVKNSTMLSDWTVMGVGFARIQNCENYCSGSKANVVVAQFV